MTNIKATKVQGLNDSSDYSDPNFYKNWFVEDAKDLLEQGMSIDEAVKATEAHIRQLFEGAIKKGKVEALKQLKTK